MLTIEDIKKTIAEIAPQFNLKKVTLFGSRANGNFREDSDVDLIVDFPDDVGLLAVISLQYKLEDIWGLSVDVISRDGLKGSMIEDKIEREIDIYAA